MKRKILAILIIAVSFATAQQAAAQFRWGPTAGITLNNLKWKQDLFTVDKTIGYAAGVAGELMFPGIGFGIDLGLYYEQRGAKLGMGQLTLFEEYGTRQSYLHTMVIPFHLRFKYTRLNGFEDTLAPFVYAGPSVGIVVAHNKIPCLEYAGGDLGIDFGVGAEIKRNWQVSLSYTMGMTYIEKAKILTNYSARSSNFALRVTYYLNRD